MVKSNEEKFVQEMGVKPRLWEKRVKPTQIVGN